MMNLGGGFGDTEGCEKEAAKPHSGRAEGGRR